MVFAYLIYIFSGLLKSFFLHFDITFPIDFTAASAILLILAIIYDVFINGIEKNRPLRYWITFGGLCVFYFWLMFSLTYSPSPEYSKTKTFLFSTNIIAFAYPITIKRFNNVLFIKYFTIFLILFDLFFIYNYQAIKLKGVIDQTGTGGLYLFLSALTGISIIILLTSKQTIFKSKLIDNIILILLFSFILMLGARGPVIFVFFVYLLFLFSKLLKNTGGFIKKNHLTIFLFTTILSVSLGTGGYLKFKDKIDPMIERTYKRFEILIKNEDNNINKSVNVRIDQLDFSFNEIFTDFESFIIGKGIGSFQLLYTGKDGRGYPHNVFIEIWFELGMVGLILFALFITTLMYRKQPNKIINQFTILYLLLNMAKSNSMVDIRVFFAFFALFLLADYKEHQTFKAESSIK